MADRQPKGPTKILRNDAASADSALKPTLKLNGVEPEPGYLEPFSKNVSGDAASVDGMEDILNAGPLSRQSQQEKATDTESLHYNLIIIQQPARARACGSGPRSDAERHFIDPPPIVKLNVFTLAGQEKQTDITMSYNAGFTVYASLEAAYPTANRHRFNLGLPPILTGVPIATANYLDNPTKAAYFIFTDLTVRHQGRFRLRFHLFEKAKSFGDSGMINRLEIVSDPFQVYSAKDFPGLLECTHLSKIVAKQGCRVHIHRERGTDTSALKGKGSLDAKHLLDEDTYANFSHSKNPKLNSGNKQDSDTSDVPSKTSTLGLYSPPLAGAVTASFAASLQPPHEAQSHPSSSPDAEVLALVREPKLGNLASHYSDLFHMAPPCRKPVRVAEACMNCRERKEVCDEMRPECSSCVSRHVRCSYQGTSDSGYGSCPGTSADGSVLNSSVHRPRREGARESERQAAPPYASREAEDKRASAQDESESNHSKFGNKPFKGESSTSDPETATAARRMPENRRGQQSPGPSVSSEGERSFMCSMDSDELAEDWEANLDPILRLLRSKLITELIDTYIYIKGRDETLQCQPSTALTASGSSAGSGQDSSSNISPISKPSNATSFGKHERSSGEASDEDDDGQEGPSHKRRRVTTTSISLDGRLLACPYFKFDPARYSERNLSEKNYRGCSSIYLTTISRVKQHLYRVHKRPDNYCLSCFDTFKSEELLSMHNRARPPCEVRDPRFEERMMAEQVNLIKRRSVGKTLEETWFAIFRILFPGSPLPTTPFVDSVSAEAVQRFTDHFFRQARVRLSRLVQAQLEGRMLLESDQQRILESALESSIAQLVWQTGPYTESDGMLQEFPGEDVQHRDAEDYALNAAGQAPLPQVAPSAVPIGGGNMLEEFLEDSWPLRSPGYFEEFYFGSGEDTLAENAA